MCLSVCLIEFQIFFFHMFHENNYHVHQTIIIFRVSKTNVSFLDVSVDQFNTILFPVNYVEKMWPAVFPVMVDR